jgi:hypothetical protein
MLRLHSLLLLTGIVLASNVAAQAPSPANLLVKFQGKPKPPGPNDPPEPLPKAYFETPPAGWLPVTLLDEQTKWTDVRAIEDKVMLYFPKGDKPVRGIYVSVVFHSQDPREAARLWDFALVTIPWKLLYDIGLPDTRSPRGKQTGLQIGNMAWLLHYLDKAAGEAKHPELAVAPIVGWLMQGGQHHAPDLFKRAPGRVIAWADAFSGRIDPYTDFTAKVPFVLAWEFDENHRKKRAALKDAKAAEVVGKPTPPSALQCEASTYDFPHGVYSKWNLFTIYLDRCIKAALPEELPPPGQPTKLRPFKLENGWVADFNEVSEWVPIAPAKEAKGMIAPQWLPDEYAAWAYRAYHSHNPALTLTAPIMEYKVGPAVAGMSRGQCGLGFGEIEGKAGEPISLQAGPRLQVYKAKFPERPWEFVKVEFRDGDKLLGTASEAPWKLDGVKLERGLHVLIPVGVKADGTRVSGRPALFGVR